MIDLPALTAVVFNRLAFDAAGSPVRAALGAGATSILHAAQLRRETLPARPFVALRRFAVPIRDRIIWLPRYNWYVYDDSAYEYTRIEALLPLIGTAYDYASAPLFLASGGAISDVAIDFGEQTTDQALDMLVCQVRLYLTA